MFRATIFSLLCIFGLASACAQGYNNPVVEPGQYYAGSNTYGQDAPLYQPSQGGQYVQQNTNVQVSQNQQVAPAQFNGGWRPGAVSPFPQIKRSEHYHRHDHYHHQAAPAYQNYSHYYPQQQQHCQPTVYYYPHTQSYWYWYYPSQQRCW